MKSIWKKWGSFILIPTLMVVFIFIMDKEANRFGERKSPLTKLLERQEKSTWTDRTTTTLSADDKGENDSQSDSSKVSKDTENKGESAKEEPMSHLEAKQLQLQNQLIQEKLKRLEGIRQELDGELAKRKEQDDKRISKLVQVVEKMRPQAAAEFMEAISDDLAIEILERLSVEKGSKIFNLIKKDSLAKIGEKYAGYENQPRGLKE